MAPVKPTTVALLIAVALLPACGPKVAVQAERSTIATFGRYDTYAWASPVAPARAAGETQAALVDWRIHNAVDRGLAAKGYVRVDRGASLLVDYDVATPEKSTAAFRDYFAYRRQDSRLGMGEAFAGGFAEGTLVLQLMDTRTRQRAYWATATHAISEDGADGARIDDAVAGMLKDLPPAMVPRGR
jgi:hypothetical protein